MGKKLLRFLTKSILLAGLLFGVICGGMAQSAGDIAFVGISSVSNEFAFVALSDLPANINIYFTNAEWNGHAFEEGEGDLQWQTGSEPVPAGTIVTVRNIASGEVSATTGWVEGSHIDFSAQQDVLFAYMGSAIRTPAVFLAAISNHESQYNGINGFLDGTGLTEGGDAVLLNNGAAQAAYRGVQNGKSAAGYRQLIGDTQNWQQTESQQGEISIELDSFEVLPATGVEKSTFMSRVEGVRGWHGMASPAKNTSFDQLLNNLWVQGVPGSDNPGDEPSILLWNEKKESFEFPNDMEDPLEPGRGYFVYLRGKESDAAEPGKDFSEVPAPNGEPYDRVVNVPVSATDVDESGTIDGMEGFNLLANPFNQPISVGAVKEAIQLVNTNINAYLYVWNADLGDGNGGFEAMNDADVIGAAQPFWVRYLEDGVNGIVRFDRNNLTTETTRETYRPLTEVTGNFELSLSTEERFDTYEIELRENGAVGEDRYDGYELFSLNAESINLFSTGQDGNRIAKNAFPNRLDQPIEIPLLFSAEDQTSFSFNWEDPDELPREWELMLIDREVDREVNLRTTSNYSFEIERTNIETSELQQDEPLLNQQTEPVSTERFSLAIRPSGPVENIAETSSESTRLRPNYPNPFASYTTIPFELAEPAEVTLTIWNMIGQKVATLVDSDPMSEGPHEERWDNVSNMPSGMYIARLEAGGEVFTRKMTLIK